MEQEDQERFLAEPWKWWEKVIALVMLLFVVCCIWCITVCLSSQKCERNRGRRSILGYGPGQYRDEI